MEPRKPEGLKGSEGLRGGLLRWLEDRLGADRVVLALSLARLGDGVGNSILIVTLPLYVARIPSPWMPFPTPVLVGILIALYGYVNSAVQPLAGALIDRFGRRKAFIQGGLLLMAGSTASILLANTFTELVAVRAVQGVGFALTLPASLTIMKAATRRSTRGGAMGVFTTMRMVGFSIGPLVGGYLQSRYGFPAAFYTGAGFIVLGMVAVQVWVTDPAESSAGGARFRLFDRSLFDPALVSLAGATFVMAASVAMMSALENQFNVRLEQTAFGFGVAFSALTLSRVIFQIPLGSLSDHTGRKPVIIAGLLLLAPATVALAYSGSTLQLTGFRLIQGIATAGIAAPAFALAADVARVGGEGRQLSILTMGFSLGIATGPLLAGILAVVDFHFPFYIAAALALASAWIVHRYVRETVTATSSS